MYIILEFCCRIVFSLFGQKRIVFCLKEDEKWFATLTRLEFINLLFNIE